MRAISVGPVSFDIPDWLDARDDGGTLVAYPPQTDYATLRVSVSTIATDDGTPSPGAGERTVRNIAAKEHRSLQEEGGKVWYSYSEAASDGSRGSKITFWNVGFGAHTALISCFIDSIEGDGATKKRVVQAIIPLIRSLSADDASA